MSTDRQNSNILFFLCLLTGILALIFLPVSRLDTLPFSDETTALPEKDILSYQQTASYSPPKYLICSIDDDLEDVTNHGIYHPFELAIDIEGLKKLGIKHLFLGTHLHWPDLDKKENGVLNTTLSELDSCIISVPLRRTASPVPLPDFLQQTSISPDQVKGNISLLPKVNNLSLAPTFEIPKNTRTGFSQLETELPSAKLPLLAYWDDRVILSSLLLERMHHLKISPNDLVVQLGNHIKLGATGNIIPIDEFGYFTPTSYPAERKPDILASLITDVKKSPVATSSAILTAEGLQADNYRAINQPGIQLQQLTLTPVLKERRVFKRLHPMITIITLIAVAYLLGFTFPLPLRSYLMWVILLCIFWAAVALTLVKYSDFYLPMTHLAVAILTGCLCYFILKRRTQVVIEKGDNFIDFDSVAEAFTARKRAKAEAKIAKKQYKLALKNQRKERKRKKREDKEQRKKPSESSENVIEKPNEKPADISDSDEGDDISAL